jgi:hypothetical protein
VRITAALAAAALIEVAADDQIIDRLPGFFILEYADGTDNYSPFLGTVSVGEILAQHRGM